MFKLFFVFYFIIELQRYKLFFNQQKKRWLWGSGQVGYMRRRHTFFPERFLLPLKNVDYRPVRPMRR